MTKLIDILVKELPKQGGWDDEAVVYAQDVNGGIYGYRYEDMIYAVSGFWRHPTDRSIATKKYTTDRTADDHATALITRDQYEAALAAAEGWIEWGGGVRPIYGDAIVDVKIEGDASPTNKVCARLLDWSHVPEGKIIAYRLHRAEPAEPVSPPIPAPGTPAMSAEDAVLYWKNRAETAEGALRMQENFNKSQGETIEEWKFTVGALRSSIEVLGQRHLRTQSKLKARNIKINQLERLLMECERKVTIYGQTEHDHDCILSNHAKIIQAQEVAREQMTDNVKLALALAESPACDQDHADYLRRLIVQDVKRQADKITDMIANRYDVDLPF